MLFLSLRSSVRNKILAVAAALACATLLCSKAEAQSPPGVKTAAEQPPVTVKSAARSKAGRALPKVLLKREVVTGRRLIPRATVQIARLPLSHQPAVHRPVFVSRIGRRIHQKPF